VQDYIIVTDATCDLPEQIVKDLNIVVLPMEFIMDNKIFTHYPDAREMSFNNFYNNLKMGSKATTTQINYNTYKSIFSRILSDGKDILYISFSSGLSGTYNGSRIVINELFDEFPHNKIYCVDSLSASIGEGLLVYLAALMRQNGLSIDELTQWVENKRFEICHWFAVDDLEHLKSGGRINGVQASIGSMLNLKPILSVDKEGKLVTITKMRGKKKSHNYLAQRLKEDGESLGNQTIIIGHAACEEDAIILKELILQENLAKDIIISNIGPIIGTHTGIGMIAVTFIGRR
jgi:DegV family protein with EDD domain